jgi:glutamate racemase
LDQLSSAPIGIFDSGIGGLTVAKAVMEALPNEDIIYFGDTARVPYGIKSQETVREYALEITDFLLRKKVKLILIACNTVSASAKPEIEKTAGMIPILDVITSGTKAVFDYPDQKEVGVIGTLATINAGAYVKSIAGVDAEVKVIQQACPLLVPLAEEGWTDNDIAMQTLRTYLQPFSETGIQSIILGCTHYPLFKRQIKEVLHKPGIHVIDSAQAIAESTREKLAEMNALNEDGGRLECYVTDRPQRFQELAERFLGRELEHVHIVHL